MLFHTQRVLLFRWGGFGVAVVVSANVMGG